MCTIADALSRFYPYLITIFVRERFSRIDAEDQTQETCLRAVRYFGVGRHIPTEDDELRRLLGKIARRVIFDWRRKQSGRGKKPRRKIFADDNQVRDAEDSPGVRAERTAKAFEACACVLVGAFLCKYDLRLGQFVIFGFGGLLAKNGIEGEVDRKLQQRMQDAELEQRYMLELRQRREW